MVQGSVKLLHVRKIPTILLKVDIARAFDSVSWQFPLEIMEFVDFSRTWGYWTSVLLSSASTRVLMNGNPGERTSHSKGLQQGDPLSPMLFLLIMEGLSALICKADKWSLLQPLGTRLLH
jgi:hypothetical protein